jgi:uncharacterized protein (DUF2252 family)
VKAAPSAPTGSRPASAATEPRASRATPGERREAGRACRRQVARAELARAPRADDPQRDPIAWLQHSNLGRVPELVPLRHGRMLASPFAFYRGAAALMAHDLGALPHSGVTTQLCGDAHLSNFGFFASPERTLLFDLNDFDETLEGPFDWDLRRLAASFAIAAREIGLKDRDGRDAVWMLADAYRDRLARFARMDTLEQWYYRLTSDTLLELGGRQDHELEVIRKARRSTSQVFAEDAVERVPAGGEPQRPAHLNIVDRPPFVYHDAQATRRELGRLRAALEEFLATYRASLASERRVLLSRYELHDLAVMTPGVGSVGRRCFLLLLVADGVHPLFLQCKEAGASVLESHAGPSPFEHDGERIVGGQRLMQAASDIFLGWAGTTHFGEFYVRQLRDMKASFKLEQFGARDLVEYAEACGYALARAHAKAGDPWRLFGYVGRSKSFNRALVDFAVAYADVNEADWSALAAAVRAGRLQARTEAENG